MQLFILGKIKLSMIQWTGSTHSTSQRPDAMRVCVIHPIIHHMSSIDKNWGHSNGSQNWMTWTPSVTCLFFLSPRLFFHRAGFINNTLHSLRGYILKSKLPFNFHDSLTQELAPSREIKLLVFSSLLPFEKKEKNDTMQPLCRLCANICTTSPDKQATLHFFSYKHFPEGTTRKFHCFFEGSVQLHVPKSTWLPGRPFWSLVSEQLRRSSFGINCVLSMAFTFWATWPVFKAACAKL